LAIIDTGATATAVDEEVCRKLGLQATGTVKTAHAGGSEVRACYPIEISFPGTPFSPFTIPRAMSVNLQFGKTPYILLFGRDLLAKMKFVYNGLAGRFEIAF
jgi:predicted aspartyl protease